MRIAFDLDDTLIPCAHDFPVEKPTLLARLLSAAPLRRGAVELLRELRGRGCDLWVYTTSLRNPFSVWLTFRAYGIRLRGVVNHDRHVRHLQGRYPDPRQCSKYPPAFGVDLLVDDSEGVRQEGQRYRFRVLWLHPRDEGWAAKVRAEVAKW
jgi:hypothetical protein